MSSWKRRDKKGRILKTGEGQMPDGRYRYQYIDATGKRKAVYSWKLVDTDKTPAGKREDLSLREKIQEILRDLSDGIRSDGKKLTVNELFFAYMKGKRELKQSTRSNYRYMYERYVADVLGYKKIAEVRYSDIRAYYNTLVWEKGFRPNSIEVIHTILHPIFQLAMRDGYIRMNPTEGAMAELKKSCNWERPKRHALTLQEQNAFITFMANSNVYRHWLPLFTVLLGTGCRVGEIIGLRWEDCDFHKGTISINHNLVYRQQENGSCQMHVTTPKTNAGIRIIPMLDEVKAALLQEKQRQEEKGVKYRNIDGYEGFVFTNRNGYVHNPVTINRTIKRVYTAYNLAEEKKAAEERRQPILIRHFSVHNLRHTFCTRFCEQESNIKIIQEIMGHSDISTTMNIYAEATEEMKSMAFSHLQGKIKIS